MLLKCGVEDAAVRRKARLCGAAALLAGGAWTVPAQAQDSAALIEQRIEAVFNIVPRNAAELAIPLTRRALARRSAGDEIGRVPPLAYRETSPAAPVMPAAEAVSDQLVSSADLQDFTPPSADSAAEGDLEQGSAEDELEADEDVARMPRPRPVESGEQDAVVQTASLGPRESNTPLDLVAGAARQDREGPVVPAPAEVPAQASRAAGVPVAAISEARSPMPPPAQPIVTAAVVPPASSLVEPFRRPQRLAKTDAAPMPRALRDDCLSVKKLADKDEDFARNAAALAAPGFCLTQVKFKERRRPWTVQTIDSGRPGPLWAIMHDDEDTAFDSAVDGLAKHGGVLFTVDTGGKRNQDGIDPNRNFSDNAISCPKLGESAAPKFTAAFQELMDPARPIIALHSNFNGRVPTTGIGHVSMTTVPKKMRAAKSNDPDGPLASERALVLLAAADPVDTGVETTMETLSGKGVNVVLETVNAKQGDCSLSNYAVLSGHTRYANVTVDHDEGDKQLGIIEAILADSATVAAAE